MNTVYCYSLAHEFWLNVEHKNGIVYAAFRKGLIHSEVLDSAGVSSRFNVNKSYQIVINVYESLKISL